MRRGPGSCLPDLAARLQADADPRAVLHGTGLLAGDGQLLPDVATWFRIAASPERLLTIASLASGARVPVETRVAQSARGVCALLRTSAGRHELLLETAPAEAAKVVCAWHELRPPREPEGGAALELRLSSYAALLATADVSTAAKLRATTARRPEWKTVLTAAVLEARLRKGLTREDSTWRVSAARKVCRTDLTVARGGMERALEDLRSAGVVRPIPRGFTLTESGERLIADLRGVVHTSGLTLSGPAPDRTPAARVTALRGAERIHLAEWADVAPGDVAVRFTAAGASACVDVVRRLLDPVATPTPDPRPLPEPVPRELLPELPRPAAPAASPPPLPPPRAPRLCAACRAPLRPGVKFCARCGERVA